MRNADHLRLQRELLLAAFGTNAGVIDGELTDRLVSVLDPQFARAGEKLFAIGDPPDSYYFMREGRVQLVRDGTTPWTFEGRCVFGMADALLDRPRTRTALAVTDVQAMRIQSDAWMELLEDSFALARAAVGGAVRTVAGLEARLWSLQDNVAPRSAPSLVFPSGPLDVLSRLAVLLETTLLRRAGVQILADLATGSEVMTFANGQVLVEPGIPPERFFVVIEGSVEAHRQAPDVRWRGGPGDVVCGTAAFGDPILAWHARAVGTGRALAVRVDDWMDLLEEHFEVVRSTLATLSLESERLLDRLP